MEKLMNILLGTAILYAVYALGIKRWDYASEAKREEMKIRLQKQGLAVRYYFISTNKLLLLNLLSGGLFLFFWSYKQWQAVCAGYKNSSGKPLGGGPFWRAVFTVFTFYQFNAILNRTCLYMHKKPTLPCAVWGTLCWTGLTAACIPALPLFWRMAGGALFLYAPCALQKRVNALPKQLPPARLKTAEILWLPVSWIIWLALAAVLRGL